MTEEIKNNSNKLRLSLVLHIIIGVLVLWGVFLASAMVNKLPISAKTLAPPTLVGLISGYLVYASKKKIIEANMNLENIVSQRTLDLKVANDLLNDRLADIDALKKAGLPKSKSVKKKR